MAELVLKVGDSLDPLGYKDGDILHAFTRKNIRRCHAEMICHVRDVPFNSDGLNPEGSLPFYLYLNTREYLFQRVSPTEVQRTNLFTNDIDVLSDKPNDQDECIDVGLYLARQLRYAEHSIFGSAGSEIWFGGSFKDEHSALDSVWQKIEEMTPKREVDHSLFPLSSREKKSFLALPVHDFTDASKTLYESAVVDENEQLIEKRKHVVEYAEVVDHQKLADIQDKAVEVDVREEMTKLTAATIAVDKEAIK
jgi:hypothetical protein